MNTIPQHGQLIDVGGYRLYAHIEGSGQPTIVLDNGLGATSVLWEALIPHISDMGTVIAYDLANYGWSDLSPPNLPRTSQQIVKELHALLQSAQLEPPYLLVGNSFGGINCLLYAYQHPDEVLGMVMVDPSVPELFDKPIRGVPSPEATARLASTFEVLARIKLMYVLGPLFWRTIVPNPGNLPSLARQAHTQFIRQPKLYKAWKEEARHGYVSFQFVKRAGDSVGDIPMIVLSAGALWESRFVPQELKDAMKPARDQLAQRSTRGEHRMISGASHAMQVDNPDAVARAIQDVVAMGT